jgi:hypothetical protein
MMAFGTRVSFRLPAYSWAPHLSSGERSEAIVWPPKLQLMSVELQ